MNPSASSAATTDNDPYDLFRSATNLVIKVAIATVVVVGTIIFLALMATPDHVGSGDMSEQAVASRIQKVGSLVLGDASGGGARTGEELYKGRCAACHDGGLLGSPKLADKGAWSARIASGYETLLTSALKGKKAMPAQGGSGYSDADVGRAVVYMANAAGAKFAEPKAESAGAAAAPAPAPQTKKSKP